jgi:CRP-like cAMP-binding protein
MGQNSCFVEKMSRHTELTDQDRDLLATLEEDETTYCAGQTVRDAEDPVEAIYVVKEGWLFSSVSLGEDRRQILQFFVPGDLIGLHDLPYGDTSYKLVTMTDVVLCPFPKHKLGPVLKRSPKVTGLIFTFSLVDHTIMLDRLKAIGRLPAKDRIVHLMLTIRSRLALTQRHIGETFNFPIPQIEVADALGLTPVTISRCKSELQDEGSLRWYRKEVEFLNRSSLEERTGFSSRYHKLDVSWFDNLSNVEAS